MTLSYPAMRSHGLVFRTQSAVPNKKSPATNNNHRQQKNKTNKEKEEYSAPVEATEAPAMSLIALKETSYYVMDETTRRLVEMANRYLRKHRSDGGCSPKRQRLDN